MKTVLTPVALNESSLNVSVLHKVLRALGRRVSESEEAKSLAGEGTLREVRALQAQLNITAGDSTVLDQTTIGAVTQLMKTQGLLSAKNSFTVSGTVKQRNGHIRKRQRLLAFDLDLPGVAVYRTIKTLDESRQNGGFEFIGEAFSSSQGSYRFTFYDWQYSNAERKKADIVVYAAEDEEIIGRSRLVNSEEYSDKGEVRKLDVFIVKEDDRTEYEIVMGKLNAFLSESKVTLTEIIKSIDQIKFIAGELDLKRTRIVIAGAAEILAGKNRRTLSHELLYGLGRQGIRLTWAVLYKKTESELQTALERSVEQRTIKEFSSERISAFLQAVRKCAVEYMLGQEPGGGGVGSYLSLALPEESQRVSFMNALRDFSGNDFTEFWNEYLPSQEEFKNNPEAVSKLLLTQQLTVLSGNHQAFVTEVIANRKISSLAELIELEDDDWNEVLGKTGVPDFITGINDEERKERYADLLRNMLNAAFPTRRIASMVSKNELPIEKTTVSRGISSFLKNTGKFDFASSRVHDFDKEIQEAAGDEYAEVRSELMKLQRLFQVSPTPDAMKVLLENNLESAYTIANIPQKSFIKRFSQKLEQKTETMAMGNGLAGESLAYAIHERATYISLKSEMTAMHMMEASHALAPAYALSPTSYDEAMTILEGKVPNYSELFGSPDVCECEHCRSVYSAAAYMVDLLRFLSWGDTNSDGKPPLDMLAARRPDLLHLPLTCENTNTIIPYIDLANEVMEYYTANGSLTNFEGYDTGETTEEELRANPQNFNLEAYRKLKDAKYPFTLPYHQPLNVIRTYSDHLTVSRDDVLRAANPLPDTTTKRAIEAESIKLSEEEYKILTGEEFDGTADVTPLHEYFGYSTSGDLADMQDEVDADGNPRGVRVLLERAGLTYEELVELVETQFINPYQAHLSFLQELFSGSTAGASVIYGKLEQVEAGTLDPATDSDITNAINTYNSNNGTAITTGEFATWVSDHLGGFRQVITLYQPESKCDLDTTVLRTVESIYEGLTTYGITDDTWSRIHRFVRLWRRLGWDIHELDLILTALGESDITPLTIAKLESVSLLEKATKRPLNQLSALWGGIDTYGDKSLYKKLFLNRAVQQIDEAFEADAWGNYLQDETEVLGDHLPAILAAFRMSETDMNAIVEVAEVIDGGNPRPLSLDTDILNLQNLSTIYRFVTLAKALKMKVTDLCTDIGLFDETPFSVWDIQAGEFVNIMPEQTFEFYELAVAKKNAGFKSSVLEYIFEGTLPAESTLGLNEDTIHQTVKTIREAFAAIEQDHPETLETPLTSDILRAKLCLTFQADVVTEFMNIIEGTASFSFVTDANLDITIPENLSTKYSYIKGSGRLGCTGITTDTERNTLQGLTNATVNFQSAVDWLYSKAEEFIGANFGGVFSDLAEANKVLLDHPVQVTVTTLDEKLSYVYGKFLPLLKTKLRRDAITQHIAALIDLSEEATALLIAEDVDQLISDLSSEGFSAVYFGDQTWNAVALERVDETVNFSLGAASPDPLVPADNFSVRWESFVAAPASGEYTLVVEVDEADEEFRLLLDDALILQKASGDAMLSWEVIADLNAAQMHRLKLEYAEISGNAGVRLYWKTATTAMEIVPSSSAYPAGIVNAFAEQAAVFHRASEFISGFELSGTELDHFLTHGADFGAIDFKGITPEHWRRVNDYAVLRNAVPQAQTLLTDVFQHANMIDPAPNVPDLTDMLQLATAWDESSLGYLVNSHFVLTVSDFKNEIALNRIYEVMKIVTRTGLSAETITTWGEAETDFDVLNETAQLIKNTVKAKYEEEDWLELAGDLSDKIRESQKQALIGYLLMQPAIKAWGAEDADGLFEYFLIDVQMGACMDTSRIVQANCSIQMFINRCLLNLESEMSTGVEKGVSPGSIDRGRWEWMKFYRVWEANRKVFLYPENWLEPEWRSDRSEFFKDLESHLVQNDITDTSVEQGFRNYLMSLNEVANLEVCGMYQENYDSGTLKYLHVFARTHNAPYKFYYRKWNEFRKWSAWESVQADIRNEENGDESGVHLIPVVWKGRLFLFWPEFMKVQEASDHSGESVEDLSDNDVSSLAANEHLEIRLAWAENVDGKWTPKQLSKEFARIELLTNKRMFSFTASIDDSTNELNIVVWYYQYWNEFARFVLSDIQSKIVVRYPSTWPAQEMTDYSSDFMKRSRYSELELLDDVYLQNQKDHRLLPGNNNPYEENRLDHPFFFSDVYRTYFVRPVSIKILDSVRNPGYYAPYLPELVDDSGFNIPFDIPDVGPDDYMPDEWLTEPSMVIGGNGFNSPSNPTQPAEMTMRSLESGMAEEANGNYSVMTQERTGFAFMSDARVGMADAYGLVKFDTGLEFNTFYHPFSSQYVTNLNQDGVSGLLESDTTLSSDSGSTFETKYDPKFSQNYVTKAPSSNDYKPGEAYTYYKQNVCFDVFGANSAYNWELFFHAPLYIATRLSKNGKYEEAMKWFHYIFDPTTDDMPAAGESEVSRYWKVLPFKTTEAESLEDWFKTLSPNSDPTAENAIIKEWRENPFDPHLIASNRPIAYMKHVVIKYVENLVAWGDSLFRQFTMENVNEALQIYVLANHILGPYPEFVPKRGEIKAESYHTLEDKWDDFSNALVELENIFPYSSDISTGSSSTGTNMLGIGSSLYFCIPENEKLLESWDTVADRLYKIRHCQNIDGVEQQLSLFAPPIDPAVLVQATSQGLSLGSILSDLSSPPPIYRFTHLIQKANEFCADVKALGSALLSALEKKDAEELSRLRASHETAMLELVTEVRERQVLDAKANKENLEKAREIAEFRVGYYTGLLGNESVTVPPSPTIDADVTSETQLPADTSIAAVEPNVDTALVDIEESGVKLIGREKADLDKNLDASDQREIAAWTEKVGSVLNAIPTFSLEAEPFGVGGSVSFGGSNLGSLSSAVARHFQHNADNHLSEAVLASKLAGFIRREQDWTLQTNLAAKEIVQLDKQITSADIRIQVTEKELENHEKAIENAEEVELFLKDKFTNQELYQWMKEQLFAVYKQSYNLAYDMAKKAEKAYKYELGTETASFIQYGYWDNSKQGLVSADKLQLSLRQLEKSYLEENRRQLELRKSVSLAALNPLAMIELRETGQCFVSLPEEILDLDFQGHYFRRVKSVGLSVPCIAGPFTAINCSLRLLKNSYRINTTMNDEGNYEHNNDEGIPTDDDRFRSSNVPVTAIATSTGQNDAGVFEFNFRDERYLPFEGSGAISEWQLELTTDSQLRQFDFSTISDVIIHINYSARESGGLFKEKAVEYIKNYIMNAAELEDQPLMRMFDLKHEFSTEWYKFLYPATMGGEQILGVTIGKERFPFFAQDRDIVVMKIEVFAKCTTAGDYHLIMSHVNLDGDTVTSSQVTMPQSETYGGLNKATIDVNGAGLNLEELDISGQMTFKLKSSAESDFTSLDTDPEEIKEMQIVVHYRLE